MNSNSNRNDREELLESILREYATARPAEDTGVPAAADTQPPAKAVEPPASEPLLSLAASDEDAPPADIAAFPLFGEEILEEELASAEQPRERSLLYRFFCSNAGGWRFLEWFAPKRGDAAVEWIRKLCFLLALCLLLGSASYLINDSLLIPYSNTLTIDSVGTLYTPGQPPVLTPEEENFTGYPAGISEDFKKLYYANNDVRGWISYPSTSEYWYGIDYPIMQSYDNDYYLYRDFYENDNKNGSLFFDYRNDFSSAESENKMTIVYGHNMRSGQMFASLNRLVFNLGFARSAPVVYLNTLYTSAQYKVCAVFVMDEDEAGHWNYLRTDFNEYSMGEYLEEVRLRTLYFYDDVEMAPTDEYLLLYTCGNTAQNELKNGRTIVLARKLRPGESISVDTGAIRNNPEPLMPKAWYTAQGLPLPFYYTGIDPNTTTTVPDGDTTTTLGPDGETTATAPSDGDTTAPSDGDTTAPSDGDTTAPSDGDTTTPSDGDTTTPSDGDTTTPSDGDTTTPSDGDTTAPSDGDTTTPSDGDTTTPSDGDTTTPSDGDTTTPSDGDTTAPSDTDTTAPSDSDTTTTTTVTEPSGDSAV